MGIMLHMGMGLLYCQGLKPNNLLKPWVLLVERISYPLSLPLLYLIGILVLYPDFMISSEACSRVCSLIYHFYISLCLSQSITPKPDINIWCSKNIQKVRIKQGKIYLSFLVYICNQIQLPCITIFASTS